MSNLFPEAKLAKNFRAQDIKKVDHLIRQSISFSVVGMPAMGISIFLRFLATTSLAYFVHIDINELTTLNKVDLLKLITKKLGGGSSLIQLQKLIQNHYRVVLIFNRFDRLKSEFTASFFASLRPLRDIDKEKIVMIFSSNYPLIQLAPLALSGGNLNMFSKSYYLTPYTQSELVELLKLNSPNLITNDERYFNALRLSGGHYQLLQLLLKSDHILDNPLLDVAIKLQISALYKYLNYSQKKQIQQIARGKKISILDKFLQDVGLVNSKENIFTSLLIDYVRSHNLIKLSFKERKLYQLLKARLGKIVTKDEIITELWKNNYDQATDWALNSLIYRLRNNPTFEATGYIIENQKKSGYVLLKV